MWNAHVHANAIRLFMKGSTPQEDYVVILLQTARRLETEGERFLAHHRLTIAQFNILNLLGKRGAMPQAELVAELVVGKASVSSVMAGLAKRRLIRQTEDSQDRRAKVIHLTATGEKLWIAAAKAYIEKLRERFPRLDANEVARLQKALEPLGDAPAPGED